VSNLLIALSCMMYSDEAFKNAESAFITQCFEPYMYALSCLSFQDKNEWKIQYKFDQPIDLNSLDIKVSSYVSNSSADGHAKPRFSSVGLTNKYSHIIPDNGNPSRQCDETFDYHVSNNELTITLRHEHCFQEMTPLLGVRRIRIKSGPYTYFGTLDLTVESKYTPAKLDYDSAKEVFDIWNKEKRVMYFNSDSDTLTELFKNVPFSGTVNWNYQRFPEIYLKPSPNNYYKLSFWYKVLKRTDGTFEMLFKEFKEGKSKSSTEWSSKNAIKVPLKETSEWIYYSSIIHLNEETNNIALSFQFYDSTFGEAWVKEVELRPINKIPGMSGQIIKSEVHP